MLTMLILLLDFQAIRIIIFVTTLTGALQVRSAETLLQLSVGLEKKEWMLMDEHSGTK